VSITLFTKTLVTVTLFTKKHLVSVTLFTKRLVSVTLFTKKTCVSHFVYKKLVSVTLFPVLYPLYCMCVSIILGSLSNTPRLHNVYWVTYTVISRH